ncbi:MAG: hypothetical protein HYY36_01385 [Gammaproteobacteria bacterium]|nr:hypothetical protein [Gammaproteobacteria bacterium]
MWWPLCCAALMALSAPAPVFADPLGRLLTTPMQRRELDELRQAQADSGAVAVPQDILLPEAGQEAEEEKVFNPIQVKGLVSRKDGRNTAWINDSNTYEGDFSSDYLKVSPGDIDPDAVRIALPDDDVAVKVRVGQTYQPGDQQVVDMVGPYSPASPVPGQQPAPAQGAAGASASPDPL